MKLLIVTQTVDRADPVLGFFHRWIVEFAASCERVTVVCLKKGGYAFPDNVEVISLGKERGVSRARYLMNFFSAIFSRRDAYESVFVHMNPIYVILAGGLWRMMGKKIGLWYTHKQVDLKLRLAEKLVHVVFSASKESFRLETPKLRVMGHGIDTSVFAPPSVRTQAADRERVLVTSGRISSTKNLLLLVEAFALTKHSQSRLLLIGEASGPAESAYKRQLVERIEALGLTSRVTFTGAKTQPEVAEALRGADLFLNVSRTGSMDKAVLEAMACGVYVISSNEAFRETADTYLQDPSASALANAVDEALAKERKGTRQSYVAETHDLGRLIGRIVQALSEGG